MKFIAAFLLVMVTGASAQAQRIVAYGDSITNGLGISPATQMYRNQIGGVLNLPVVNRAVDGDMAGDVSTDTLTFQPLASDKVFMMIGTNDERIYGTSPALRAISMEAIRDAAVIATAPVRTVASAMTLGGTWTATPGFFGSYTDNAGSTASASICGSTIWFSYVATAWSMGHGVATVTIDGTLVDTVHGDAGGIALATQNHPSTPWFPATKRYGGLSSGCHTVQITTTVTGQRFYVEWLAGSAQPAGAPLYLSNVIRMNAAGYATYGGSDANIASYNSDIAALAAELVGDGRNVTLIDNWSAINPATDMQSDGIHLSAYGNVKVTINNCNQGGLGCL